MKSTTEEIYKLSVNIANDIAYKPAAVGPDVLSRINPFFFLNPSYASDTSEYPNATFAADITMSCHCILRL